MLAGGNREGGHANLIHTNLRRGKIMKNYEKISAEPINCMVLNNDNLFTGSEDGYL